MRDFQQSKVYTWERQFPGGGQIEWTQAQALVNHVWEAEGLVYPPKVSLIHHNTTKWAGTANRTEINLQRFVSTKTLLHEIAHSMTMTFHDPGDPDAVDGDHGPEFVGMYMQLLHRYMHIDLFHLITTAGIDGIKFNIMARPPFKD